MTAAGALARVRAMRAMACPSPELLPLSKAPALILYAEKEGAVLREDSPACAALERACHACFPRGEIRVIRNSRGRWCNTLRLSFMPRIFCPF